LPSTCSVTSGFVSQIGSGDGRASSGSRTVSSHRDARCQDLATDGSWLGLLTRWAMGCSCDGAASASLHRSRSRESVAAFACSSEVDEMGSIAPLQASRNGRLGAARVREMGACRDDRRALPREACRVTQQPFRQRPNGPESLSRDVPGASSRSRAGRLYLLRPPARQPRHGAADSVLAPDRNALAAPGLGSDGQSAQSDIVPAVAELSSIRTRRERIDQQRTGAPRVAELARHPSENGWVYDRAA
jgi:hypothetical protein